MNCSRTDSDFVRQFISSISSLGSNYNNNNNNHDEKMEKRREWKREKHSTQSGRRCHIVLRVANWECKSVVQSSTRGMSRAGGWGGDRGRPESLAAYNRNLTCLPQRGNRAHILLSTAGYHTQSLIEGGWKGRKGSRRPLAQARPQLVCCTSAHPSRLC